MSDRTQTVDFKIQAHDETQGGIRSALAHLREMQAEQRASGEAALHRVIAGGGVVGLGVEAMKVTTESATALAEGLAKVADHEGTVGQAIGGMIQKFTEGIPVIGGLMKGLDDFGGTVDHLGESIARNLGLSEEWQDAGLSDQERIKKYVELDHQAAEATDKLNEARLRLLESTGPKAAAEDAKALEEHNKRIRQIAQEARNFVLEHGGKEENLTGYERQILQQIRGRATAEQEAFRGQQTATEKEHQEHLGRMGEIEAADHAKRLTEAGQGEFAEIARIKARRDAELEKNRVEPEKQEEIRAQAEKEIGDARRREQRRIEDEDVAHSRRIADQDAASAAEALAVRGKEFEAERGQLEEHFQQELAERRRQLNDQVRLLKEGGASEDYIRRARRDAAEDIAAATRKHDADQASIDFRQNQHQIDEDLAAHRTATDAKINLLKTEGDQGNVFAKQQSERAQILLEAEEKIEAINKTLRERGDLTAQQRADYEQSAQDIADAARQNVARRAPFEAAKVYAPGGALGGGVTGFGLSAENAAAIAHFSSLRQDSGQKVIADLLQRILDALPKKDGFHR